MTKHSNTVRGPHQGQPILTAGEPLNRARAAMVPVFLGCSDVDFHVPKERVELSTQVLQRLG